jgi:hypothetical protein
VLDKSKQFSMSSTSKKEGLSKRRSEMAIARAYIRKKFDFKIIFSDNFREQLYEPLLRLNQAVSS